MVLPRSMGLAALLLAASGCHSFYSVRGTVLSCRTRAPVAGAKVDLSYPGEHGASATEAGGEFQVAVNDPPNDRAGTLVASAPGYRDETRTVHDEDKVEICLEKAAGQGETVPAAQ